MRTMELSLLLITPIILVILSISGLFSSIQYKSFTSELESNKRAYAQQSVLLADVKSKITTDTKALNKELAIEIINTTQNTTNTGKKAFSNLSKFSYKASSWMKNQSYMMLGLSILNIIFVIIVFAMLNRRNPTES